MSAWETLVLILAGLIAFLWLSAAYLRIVHEFQRGVLFSGGRLIKVLGPGRHWILRPMQSLQLIDIRSRAESVPGQEILSADNVSMKMSLALRYRVSDPQKAVTNAQSFHDALYLEAQLAVRDIVSGLPIDDLLQQRGQIATQLRERLEPTALDLGLTLESVGIKDITFPGVLKHTFAQVVEARKAAQAALERARGETATLRHLANAAKMLDGNPALMALKTLQTAGEGKHTFVLGLSQSVLPLTKEAEEPSEGGRGLPSLSEGPEEESP